MTYEIYQKINIPELQTTDLVYKTNSKDQAIRIARGYVNGYEQSERQKHMIKINGNFEDIKKFASQAIVMCPADPGIWRKNNK